MHMRSMLFTSCCMAAPCTDSCSTQLVLGELSLQGPVHVQSRHSARLVSPPWADSGFDTVKHHAADQLHPLLRCVCLSHAAAESMSAEDRAAVEDAMTSVKNDCYAAIIKAVLHVYNTTVDVNGKDKALTKQRVQNYLNR